MPLLPLSAFILFRFVFNSDGYFEKRVTSKGAGLFLVWLLFFFPFFFKLQKESQNIVVFLEHLGLFFYSVTAFSILKSLQLSLDFNVHFATGFL